MTPKHRLNYTKQAEDLFHDIKWKKWKFKTFTEFDSWLAYGWSQLFKRPMTDFDIKNLTAFIKKREAVDLKIKCNKALSPKERQFWEEQYITADGCIYMTKMMKPAPIKNPKETARLEALLKEYANEH